MANNRMYLVYIPTGDAVYLGSRMSRGWCEPPSNYNISESLEELYQKAIEFADNCSVPEAQDHFCIAMEDASGCLYVIDDWKYSKKENSDGLVKIKFNKEILMTEDGVK